MGVTLKTSQFKYKDPNTGNYVSLDLASERTAAEYQALIQTTGTTQVNAIQNKGTEVINSIPSDYTTLSNEVSAQKSAFDYDSTTEVLNINDISDIPFYIKESGFITYNTGAITSSTSMSSTNFVKVSQFDMISYKRTRTTSNSGAHGMCFYDKNYTYISGVRCSINQSSYGYDPELYTVIVPQNAYYARFTVWNNTEAHGYFEVKGKSKLSEVVNCEKLISSGDGYIDLSVGIGNTVDLTTIGSSSSIKYFVYNCVPGDKFTINGIGGILGRLYGFVDSQNKLLEVATIQEERNLYIVTAPQNAAKIVINSNLGVYPYAMSFKGVMLSDSVSPMLTQYTDRDVFLRWEDGGVDGTGLIVGTKQKRSLPISINPGEKLIIDNSNKEIDIAIYAIKGDIYRIVGYSGYSVGGGHFEITDWRWVYRIRLSNDNARPDPVTGGYISAEIVSDQIPFNPNYYRTCSYPQIGIHRTYANIKPFLTKEKKIITSEGIEPSESDCLVTLPNCGWVEVKQDGQSIMFKIAKVDSNGTITFPVSEWCYYTYRFQGDGESTYYALVEASPGSTAQMDIIKRANQFLGVYIFTDEGASYEKGYYLGGKHIAAIGDSITQGRFDKDGVSGLDSTTAKSFGEIVAETAGDDNFGNFGIGGALVSDSVSAYAWKSLQTNCGKVTGYGVVFVCGGTNDYGNNVPGNTFKTAYTEVVETLMANNTEVICCTPIYRHNQQGANTQGLWLADYADIIKEVAETKGLKVIDLLKLTSNSNMPRYMPDGLHPNEKGHKIIADWIVSECDRLAGI